MSGLPETRLPRPSELPYPRWIRRTHKGLLQGWIFSWILLFPLLQIFRDPWGLAFAGGIFALLAGQALGGGEVIEGSEEFFLSLPLPKKTLFWIKYLTGFLPLSILLLLGLACFQWNLPQKIWSIFVETGFTEPYPRPKAIEIFGALAIPFSLYTLVFVSGALLKTPSHARNALAVGLVTAGVLALGGAFMEYLGNGYGTGWGALISLGFPIPAILIIGSRAYARKELDQDRRGALSRGGGISFALLILILLFFFLLLFQA